MEAKELERKIAREEAVSSYLKNIKTCELVNELAKREGVKEIWIGPYKEYKVLSGIYMEETSKNLGPLHGFNDEVIDKGPARILVVID